MAKTKHIFVLDTCVLLHDPECIFKFEEHDIYIPLACIDDLDELKTKRENVGWSAREVFRILDQYEINEMTKGLVINSSGGKLFLYNVEAPLQRNEKPSITRVNSDNAIIDAALTLRSANPKRKVIIVSKDTGLRVRAISWGCLAENYKNDLINESNFYKGYRTVEITDLTDWTYLSARNKCNEKILNCKDQLKNLSPNEFICFKYGDHSVLAWFKNNAIEFLDDKKKDSYMGIVAKNMEQRFALAALADDSIPLVCLSGAAGCGKSLCSIAVGLDKVNVGQYERIIIIKPLVAFGGKDIGFLPGDKIEKISAWLGPFRDNIMQLTGSEERSSGYKKHQELNTFEEMIEDGIIEVEAMTFIQGRSIPRSYIIVTECENLSPKEARMVVERCGKDSKIVLEGDLSQIENPYLDKHSCGLSHAINGSKDYDVAASIALSKVERSALAAAATGIFKNRK
jgi:PhoH-like ATPase